MRRGQLKRYLASGAAFRMAARTLPRAARQADRAAERARRVGSGAVGRRGPGLPERFGALAGAPGLRFDGDDER